MRRLALFALLAACGTADSSARGTDTDAADVSTAEVDSGVPPVDAAEDVAPGDDASPDSPDGETPPLLGTGAFCGDDGECLSGLCIALDLDSGLGVCTDRCEDDRGCRSGFSCVRLPTSGADVERVCLADDLCIDADADGYGVGPGCAGADCDDTDPRVYVNAPEVCNGVDDDCDGLVDDDIAIVGDACESGFSGRCAAGVQRCAGGLLTCDPAAAPERERCNLIDDDCDGQVDEADDGTPLSRACYSGSPESRGVGACRDGAETCLDGAYTTCTGQVTPIAELCNGVDDDCDGEVDENDPESGGSCSTSLLGACQPGAWRCVDGARVCVSLVEPTVETCNGVDDDCDGEVDEAEPGVPLSRSCYTGPAGTDGVGVCRAGAQTCLDGAWGLCLDQVLPSAELCNGVNDDCDADGVDEGNPGGGVLCNTGRPGICASGTTWCSEGTLICQQHATETEETCDGRDEDCDGLVDEDAAGAPLVTSCYEGPTGTLGVGVCRAGTSACSGGSFSGACVGQVVPRVETCDGTNDDCDASGVDEGCPTGWVTVSGATASPQFGGGGGSPFSVGCPGDQVLIGFTGRAGSRMDQIAGVCGTVSVSEHRGATPFTYTISRTPGSTLPSFGGGGGSPWSWTCPADQVVTGISGRQGGELDAFGFSCSRLSVTGTSGSFTLTRAAGDSSPQFGGGGGSTFSHTCAGNDVAHQVFGRAGARLDAIGVRCGTLSPTLR